MTDLITTNILIIGKTGVGKSSLLNYIFGKEVEKTGTGKPVTEKGIFPHEFEYDSSFHLNIYDTWGLEPDKSDEWEKLIVDEVHTHDKLRVNEWFSTIIFCISAGGGPLHDFEINILRKLLQEENQILVVITKTDDKNQKSAEDKKATLIRETGIDESCVIPANSVNKKLISGECIKPYGRMQILSCIIHNLWMTYKRKTPYIIRKNVDYRMTSVRETIHIYINKIPISLFQRNLDLEIAEKHVNEMYKDSIDSVFSYMKTAFNEAIDYFNMLSKKYIQIELDFRKSSDDEFFKIDFDKGYLTEIDSKFAEISALHNDIYQLCFKEQVTRELIKEVLLKIKMFFQSKKRLKADLKRIIDNSINKSLNYIYQELDDVVEKINDIDFDEVYIKPDTAG